MRKFIFLVAAATPWIFAGCSCGVSSLPDGGGDAMVGPDGSSDGMVGTDSPAADLGPDMTACPDADHDGVTTCAGDCNDADALSATGFTELCGDGVDNDCDGTPDDGCTGGLGTFVSALTGSDTNPGTRTMPVATIRQGMMNAMTLGLPQTVVVAEGNYPEKVTLVESIELRGGYQCDTSGCSWARDTTMYASTIQNTDFEGVLAPASVTHATSFDGFHITGMTGTPSAPGSSGITLAGGCPNVRNNTITAGDVTGGGFGADRSNGILVQPTSDPAGVLIENNVVTGGTSVNNSTAINFDWMGAAGMHALATVRGNTLRGGTGQHSTGLVAWNTATGTLVTDNDIFAGSSTGGRSHGIEVGSAMTIDGNRINTDPARTGSCTTPTGFCAGISSESSTTTITNNVVIGPGGPRSAGILLGEFEVPAGAVVVNGNVLDGGGSGPASSPTESAAVVVTIGTCTTCGFHGVVGHVRNNVLLGGANGNRYGALEAPSAGHSMHVEFLENDDFYFSTSGSHTDVLYRATSMAGAFTDATTLTMVNALTSMPTAAANVSGDPRLDATWHLMSGSPCIDVGTATEAPAVDMDGDARPHGAGIDIGADES